MQALNTSSCSIFTFLNNLQTIIQQSPKHSCSIFTFLNNLQTIIQQSPKHCLIIIMGDFNVDILKDNNQAKNKQELLYFMDKFQLKSQFSESTTKA